MKKLIAVLTTAALLLVTAPTHAAVDHEYLEMKKQLRQEVVAAVINSKRACGDDRECFRGMIKDYFLERIDQQRAAKDACTEAEVDNVNKCALESYLKNSKHIFTPYIEDDRTAESSLTATDQERFDRLFAQHRQAWARDIADLLPPDAPAMEKMATAIGFGFGMNQEGEDISVSGNIDAQVDISRENNPRMNMNGSLEVTTNFTDYWTEEINQEDLQLTGDMHMSDGVLYLRFTELMGSIIEEIADNANANPDDETRRWALSDLDWALDSYYWDNNAYPADLQELIDGEYLWDGAVPTDPDGSDYTYLTDGESCYLLGARLTADAADEMAEDGGQDDHLLEFTNCADTFDTSTDLRPAVAKAETDPIAEMTNQWMSIDLQEQFDMLNALGAGLEISMSDLTQQIFPQAEIKRLIENTAYLKPVEYLGMENGMEMYQVKLDAEGLSAGLRPTLETLNIPGFEIDYMLEQIIASAHLLYFSGTLAIDSDNPKYFTLDAEMGPLTSPRNRVVIDADVTADGAVIALNEKNGPESITINVVHTSNRSSEIMVEGTDSEAVFTILEGSWSPTKIMLTAFGDSYNWETGESKYAELGHLDINRDNNGVWSGLLEMTDEEVAIAINRLKLDPMDMIIDINITDTSSIDAAQEIYFWLEVMNEEVSNVRVDVPTDAVDMEEFFEELGL